MAQHWLLKTEPDTYSFDQLLKDKRINWNGIRNFQARNNLKKMESGDLTLIYHTGDEKAVVGVAKITKTAYKDPDPDGGDWVQVDLQAVKAFAEPVPLSVIKTTPKLKDMSLVRVSRLSVQPVASSEFDLLLKMGGIKL